MSEKKEDTEEKEEMLKVRCITRVQYNQKSYNVGDVFELPLSKSDRLVELEAVEII